MNNKMENKRSESRKGTIHKRGAVRHSSPILGSEGVKEKNLQIRSEVDRSGKMNVNRSSNSSDISMPGQNLHTDSGISSSDSLAGCDKRFSSYDEPDIMSDPLRYVDEKLAQLSMREYKTSKSDEDIFRESKQKFLTTAKFPGDNIVLPLRNTNLSLECNPPSSASIFMTAMDSNQTTPDSTDHLSSWLEEESAAFENVAASVCNRKDVPSHQDARLYCSACGDQFIDPKLLPCLHTFCMQCLENRLMTINESNGSVANSRLDDMTVSPRQVIDCPVCSTEVELSLEGVHSLPVNHFIKRLLLLQNLQTGDTQSLTCDLCPDESTIAGRCVQCQSNMCLFCSEAHKRQRHTASHTILPMQGGADNDSVRGYGLNGRNVPMICQRHTSEELKLYCIECSQLVCRDCCLSLKHKDHRCEYVSSVINQTVSEIRNQFQVCEPKIASIRQTIGTLASSEKLIEETAAEVSGKVERHIASYIKALEKHRDNLLSTIKQRATSKKQSVRTQYLQLEQGLRDLTNSCDFASQLLGLGTHSEILALKSPVVQRLQLLSQLRYSESPCHIGNFVEFQANKNVKVWIEGDVASSLPGNKRSSRLLRPGLEVDVSGDVVSHVVEPKYCTAHGEGIHCCRVKLPSEFVVIAKNCKREKLDSGGDELSVDLTLNGIDQDLFKNPKIQIVNRQDGTYRVLYVVHVAGSYTLRAQLHGEDIHGSPFMVTAVDSKAHRVHTGIFHCCCFCSSGGDRNKTCACGATMPGGFRGCGHGHEGHPGSAHWSCCGKMVESSSCSRSSVAIAASVEQLDVVGMPSVQPRRTMSHRSYSTMPARGSFSRRLDRPHSTEDQLYASSSTLRSQTRGQYDPKMYFANQQAQSNPVLQSNKQVKTVSL